MTLQLKYFNNISDATDEYPKASLVYKPGMGKNIIYYNPSTNTVYEVPDTSVEPTKYKSLDEAKKIHPGANIKLNLFNDDFLQVLENKGNIPVQYDPHTHGIYNKDYFDEKQKITSRSKKNTFDEVIQRNKELLSEKIQNLRTEIKEERKKKLSSISTFICDICGEIGNSQFHGKYNGIQSCSQKCFKSSQNLKQEKCRCGVPCDKTKTVNGKYYCSDECMIQYNPFLKYLI